MLTLFVPKERTEGERRVALVPELLPRIQKLGLEIVVEPGAGVAAGFSDDAYKQSGATLSGNAPEQWKTAAIVVKASAMQQAELSQIGSNCVVGLLNPFATLPDIKRLATAGARSFSLELLPRISRAQSMDVLSSQANIAGYKAVILAASYLPRYFPLLMTAAGTIKPARVVIMGAGVAGLQAVATAKRLGAVVEVSDIRPEVQEQVESLGGKFIELPMMQSGDDAGGYAKQVTPEFLQKQQQIVAEHIAAADVVITTAQVPGKKAPVLVTEAMVRRMRSGSVIVDLAAAQGGNCELTQANKDIDVQGIQILGPANLPATMATDASTLLSRNFAEFLSLLVKDGQMASPSDDELLQGTLLTNEGQVVHERVKSMLAG